MSSLHEAAAVAGAQPGPPNSAGSATALVGAAAGGRVSLGVDGDYWCWLMIKLVFSLRRRRDLTREEFRAYWCDQHARLVSRHADVLRIRRYVQTHAHASEVAVAQSAARGSEPDVYDGQAELWWDSLEDVVAAVSTPTGQQAALELLEDERRFIDLERSPLWIGEEHLVVG
jgi:uncharacterized protein (TIGR02118 family)